MSDDEDSSEFEIVQKRAFDIGEVPDDLDLTVPPTSGLEYLQQVRCEKLRCPKIVAAKIDPKKFQNKQTINVKAGNECEEAPPGFAPSTEWQKEQVYNFSEVRMNLIPQLTWFRKNNTNQCIPKITDRQAWRIFCLGNGHSVDKGSPEKDGVNSISVGCLPLISILVKLNQHDVEKLLSYHIEWLKEIGFSQRQGYWLYALLSYLEKPLTPNVCYILRTLVRTCCKLRFNMKSKDDKCLKPLNLIICLVARYFDQSDMIDPEKEKIAIREENEDSDQEEEDDEESSSADEDSD